MRKYSILFFIKQSLSGLFMNGLMTATSIFILTSCLILMGCFGLLIYNIDINLEQIDNMNKIVFIIDNEYDTQEDIDRIAGLIQGLSNTKQIKFISKQTAFNRIKEQYKTSVENEDESSDDEFWAIAEEDNPLWNSFEIDYKDVDMIDTYLYQLRNIEGMKDIKNRADIAEFIKNLKNVIMLVLVWFLVVLFVIAIAIILNTVRLSVNSRKNEIMIMRYIGATNFFILFPFLLEGIIIGFVSATLGYFVQWYLYETAVGSVIKMDTGLILINFTDVNILLYIIFLFTGVLSGLIGSSVSSRRYLQV